LYLLYLAQEMPRWHAGMMMKNIRKTDPDVGGCGCGGRGYRHEAERGARINTRSWENSVAVQESKFEGIVVLVTRI
jgi:hypothetical protein